MNISSEKRNAAAGSPSGAYPTLKDQWLTKLRSGEYQQGRSVLFAPDRNQHCCLGVLCRVLGVDEQVMAYNDHRWPSVLQQILDKSDSYELTALNDRGKSFAEIADYIETHVPVGDSPSSEGGPQ